MGCDIHIIAEVKENGTWRKNTDKLFVNPYYISDEKLKEIQEKNPDYTKSDWQEEEFQLEPGSGRNYDWFAVLADVRNGRGFAGIRTGAGFDVIAQPKGVPADCCDEWKEYVKQWDCDMHSTSFLSIDEFDAFDWNQVTMKYGVIPLSVYKELRDSGNSPESWSGGISGPNIIVIDTDIADRIIAGENIELQASDYFGKPQGEKKPASEFDVYVGYEWPVLYKDWFEHNIKTIVEPLRELSKKYEDARIVFGFDN